MPSTNRQHSGSVVLAHVAAGKPICDFCGRRGHLESECREYKESSASAKTEAASWKKSSGKAKAKANEAQTSPSTTSAPATPSTNSGAHIATDEFAGHASLPTTLPTSHGSDWNADTGATSHMTPHRHWFKTYTPFRSPIHLADGSIVYSAGVGSVLFQPIIDGKEGRLLEFERVLHVPDLRSNLLAVLYLSKYKGYTISIKNSTLRFTRNRTLLFTATVNSRNAAYLDGEVIFEVAGAASTCPTDLTLWHRRLAHLNLEAVKKLAKQELVTGLSLQPGPSPDPICEPCIAGKQHRRRVPKTAQHRASHPLEVVHSDLHGPIPVHSREGYKYWITFIDDYSRFYAVGLLKTKGEAFTAFRYFKAWMENKLDTKIKELRDDKGGEYMSEEFETFLATHGIARQHTLRDEPHQNGVAERANRTLVEGITTMLNESRLPPSFWNLALNAFVHVHNRSPTSAVPDSTPYERMFKSKPDVAHLRVFGCLSYVHVKKDQRKGLQSHTNKCVFVGYPPQYKGWLFYNWETKRFLISDAVIFDERSFPGSRSTPLPLLAPAPFPPDLDDEDCEDQGGVIHRDNGPHSPQLLQQELDREHELPVLRSDQESDSMSQVPQGHMDSSVDLQPNMEPREHRISETSDLRSNATLPPIPPAGTGQTVEPQNGRVSSTSNLRSNPTSVISMTQSTNIRRRPVHHFPFINPYSQERRSTRIRKPAAELRDTPVPLTVQRSTIQIAPDERNIDTSLTRSIGPGDSTENDQPAADASDNQNEDGLEQDDGHEDMDESAMHAALAAGLDHMESVDCEVTFFELFDLVLGEMAMKAGASPDHPRTLAEALRRPDGEFWYKCAQDEILALEENGVFTVRQRKPGDRPVGSRWVFRIKRKADGSIERRKGRVVAQGFSQRPGFDFHETFASTARWAALRAILALASFEDMEIESVDISSAFLNGDLEENITMKVFEGLQDIRPELFKDGPKDPSAWVLELHKSLYGLKQSPRMWNQKLHKAMSEIGFARVKCDHSIWVYAKDDIRIIVPVYVDDITIVSKPSGSLNAKWVKDELKKRFKLRDLGPTSFLLGVEVVRDRAKRSLTLSQRQCIIDTLAKYGMSDCNPVSTPLDPSIRLDKSMAPQTEEEVAYMQQIPYREAVGSLMYIAIATRPDIQFSVGILSRFSSNPGPKHWESVKHLFRYLQGSKDYKLTYAPDPSSSSLFTTYCDADFAGDKGTTRSTSGYVVKMGTGAVSWASRLQSLVTLSTTEAEYVSAVAAGQEMLWLHNLFTELGYPTTGLPLCIDNQSALSVTKNPEHHGRMKHLDLRFYWLRDVVYSGTIAVRYIPTADQPADILTKSLGKSKVILAREQLGLWV